METAIKLEHVNKYFGAKQILHDVTFETYTGEVFGFLGPNGAGKTTTIKMIVGLLKIDEGSISICGHDVEKDFTSAMAEVGGIVENPECYKYMTGMQNLKQYARMRKGVTEKDIEEAIELVGLKNRINEKVSKYSLGMRQRLGLAQALLHHPHVLILDEPTNGLDPAGIKHLRDILKNIAHNKNVCVLVSSHLMSEMELMCDRVGIIANGKVLDVKSMNDFLSAMDTEQTTYIYHVENCDGLKELLDTSFADITYSSLGNQSFSLTIPSAEHEKQIAPINQFLFQHGVSIITVFAKEVTSLEDAFIELTKNGGSQIA